MLRPVSDDKLFLYVLVTVIASYYYLLFKHFNKPSPCAKHCAQ